MSFDNTLSIVLVITNDLLLYITLPLHARLLYVLLKPSSKKDLDSSFHTLMINTTIVNLIFALDCCIILEPSAAGVFFEFYDMMGPYFAKIELIKTTTIILTNNILHLILSMNRFTAIAFPLRHKALWGGRRLFWFCIAMWIFIFCISIPLMLPGSTAHTKPYPNIYGVRSVEFTFLGNYYFIYSMGTAFPGMGMEIASLLFYFGMLVKFNDFRKVSMSGAADVKRMTRGVLRTTLAALCIAAGAWSNVVFAMMIYISYWTRGVSILDGTQFSATLRFLTSINNVLTPWVMLIAFNNIRFLVFGRSKSCQAGNVSNATSSVTKF